MGITDTLLARLEKAPRTGSLIVTIWGDAVIPRGGSLWLGTLQAILDRFGCNEGQVRTAMSRLTEEGWLTRNRQGRLSFYRLGPRGQSEFEAAARRIYHPAQANWDGQFRLVLSAGPEDRDRLARQGFAPFAPAILIGTTGTADTLPASAEVLNATPRSAAEARAIASRSWPLEAIAQGYQRFLHAFAALEQQPDPPGEDALPLRLLLVHEWRRVVLRDPRLPAALLPGNWPGTEARALAARLYHRLLPASEAWLSAEGRAEDGPLPPAGKELAARFRDG